MLSWILFPAVAMSLGWGLRGFIGGGELGAMIPGALVAMCLCLLLDRDGDDAAVIAAWGAIGFGFGGQMTYGQTIGLALAEATRAWGLTGLTLKGAIWGFLGNAIVALALSRHRFQRRDIYIALALLCAATYAGWKLFNEPKLIYFSHPTDKPRAEIWFGLLAGAIALLAWLRDAMLWRLALVGAVAGGIGFGVGGYIQVAGRTLAPTPLINYWKLMEFFLGFMLGIGLGVVGRWSRLADLAGSPVCRRNLLAPLIVPVILLANQIPGRATYSYLGAVLLALTLTRPEFAWHVAITTTYCAFSIDFLRSRPEMNQTLLWIFVVVTTVAAAWFVERTRAVRPLFLFLLLTSVGNSLLKSFAPGWREANLGHILVEVAFVVMMLGALRMLPRRVLAAALSGGLLLFPQSFTPMEGAIRFKNESNRSAEKYLPESMVGGVALIDYDGDGRLDVYLVNGAALGEKPDKSDPKYWNRLFRNQGEWKFTDVTEKAGVAGHSFGMGTAVGDFDSDGRDDLYVTSLGSNILYRNNGDGTFADVTAKAGVAGGGWSTGAAFLDYDADGKPDLFVARYLDWSYKVNPYCGDRKPGYRSYCHPDQFKPIAHILFRNNGNGTFADVSAKSGIAAAPGKGLGVAINDFDRDGRIDIFVANDSYPQQLFRNKQNGAFEEVGLVRGVGYDDDGRTFAGMGCDFTDYDNDGWPDIFVNALANQRYGLFRNVKGVFEYSSGPTRIGAASQQHSGWGTALADFDNDGWRDLFVAQGHVMDNIELTQPNLRYQEPLLLLRNGKGQFQKVPVFDKPLAARGAAFGDLDNDGWLDIVINVKDAGPVVLRNNRTTGNHWLMIEGAAPGTPVRVTTPDGISRHAVASRAGSYLSSNDGRVHFGLGANASAVVEVGGRQLGTVNADGVAKAGQR